MSQYGHFGRPSIRLVVVAAAGLLLHLFLPFGIVQYGGPAAPDNEILLRSELMEIRGFVTPEMLQSNASPTVALVGFILAAAGGGLLFSMGFRPLQVNAARWIGHGGALLGGIGAAMVWMSSMYSVGTGFASFLTRLFGGDFRAHFWAISPVLSAGLAGMMFLDSAAVARAVISSRDGLRGGAERAFTNARWGLVLMGVVLLVPWSIGILPDGVSDSVGFKVPGEDGKGGFFFSAEDVQSATPAELASGRYRYSGSDDFGVLSASVHVFMALSWSLVVAGWLQAMAATATSAGAPLAITRGARFMVLPLALLLATAGVMYVLAWVFFAPNPDVEYPFLPGFFPLLVLVPFVWLARPLMAQVVEALQGPPPASADWQ